MEQKATVKINIVVDTSELDKAIEKANQLTKALSEAKQLIDSLSARV